MAKLCSHCGATLFRDDARFCMNCGTPVPAPDQPSTPSTPLPLKKGDPITPIPPVPPSIDPPMRSSSPGLREQVARQPGWQGPSSSRSNTTRPRANPQSSPGYSSIQQNNLQPASKSINQTSEIPDVPTLPFISSSSSSQATSRPGNVIQPPPQQSGPYRPVTPSYQIVRENTPLPQGPQSNPGNTYQAGNRDIPNNPSAPGFSPVVSSAKFSGVINTRQATPRSSTPVHRSRPGPWFWLTALILIIAISAGGFLLLMHPFTTSSDPWQHYSNSKLGFELDYPADWKMQEDQQNAILHFFDSSHTDQVDIQLFPAGQKDANQALQQQITQLGMTDTKNGDAQTIGNTSWQQMQGKRIEDGANYLGGLFATSHNNRVYLFMQFAPDTTYSDEVQYVFKQMQNSWRFLD